MYVCVCVCVRACTGCVQYDYLPIGVRSCRMSEKKCVCVNMYVCVSVFTCVRESIGQEGVRHVSECLCVQEVRRICLLFCP